MIKKVLAIGIICASIVSCKQEKKETDNKVDTNVEEKKEISIENENEKKEEVFIPAKAISDSAGVFTQKFILEVGKTYPFSSVQKEVQTLTDPTGKSISGTQETYDERNVVVDKFENGIYDLTINIMSKKLTSKADGKTVVIDTKKAAPKEEQLKNIWTINKTLVGSKFNVKMNEKGEVISVDGLNTLYSKIEKAITPLIKEANHRKQFLDNFKLGFNEAIIKEEFSKGINILPKKGIKIGESWTETENVTPDGKVKSTLTYTLEKVENGVAEIKVKGSIPAKSEKQTQNGVTATISIDGSQKGSLKIDENTGWILNSKLNIKTNTKQTMTDGKRTESIKQVSDNTITIN